MTNHRVLHSILAALALVVLLIGVPVALLVWGRSPLDGSGSLWEQQRHFPTQTVSDNVAFGMLTVAAWVGWGLFVISVATEFAAALGVATRWGVPTPGPIQVGASRLVMSFMTDITLISPLGPRARSRSRTGRRVHCDVRARIICRHWSGAGSRTGGVGLGSCGGG